ncbi:MAG: hypothetical protein QN187_16285 [Armatimonadota bacterium]|nr:hypothetical protein [Armatimonadota bacterium]
MSVADQWDATRARQRSRQVATGGAALALAVVLPAALHPFGLGPVLLPMHLVVLVTAGLAGPVPAALAGALAPLTSWALTGMPPLSPPVAPLMTIELAAYGGAAGVVWRWLGGRFGSGARGRAVLAAGLTLVAAIAASKLALAAGAALFGPMLGLRVPVSTYLMGAALVGVPGIVLQAAVAPLIFGRVRRGNG